MAAVATPVPVMFTDLEALPEMLSVAVSAPAAAGAKLSTMVQLAETATVPPSMQVPAERVKSVGFAPETV